MARHLNKLESSSPTDALCQVWMKSAQRFWRWRFFNFVNLFSLFCNYLPLGKGVALHLNKLESPFSHECSVPSLDEIGPAVLEKKIFKFRQYVFAFFVIISPWKRAWPLIWTNLNSLYPKMICVKFGWNWLSGSGEEDKNVKSLQTKRRTDRRTDGRLTTSDLKRVEEIYMLKQFF